MRSRLLSLPLALMLALGSSGLAVAAWTSLSRAEATVSAGDVDPGRPLDFEQGLSSAGEPGLLVSWDPSLLSDGREVQSYEVFREIGAAPAISFCTSTGTSCFVASPPEGEATYWVVPRFESWTGAPSERVTYAYDGTAPVTTFSIDPGAPNGSNGWYTSISSLSLSATDEASAIDSISWTLADRGTGGETSDVIMGDAGPVSVPGDGRFQLTYAALDERGNREAQKSASFKIDSTAPITTYDADTGAFSASDAASGVAATYYRIGSGAQQTWTGTPIVLASEQTVTYWSVDAAGKTEPAKSYTAPKADVEAPKLIGITPAAGAYGSNGSKDTWTPALSACGSTGKQLCVRASDDTGVASVSVQISTVRSSKTLYFDGSAFKESATPLTHSLIIDQTSGVWQGPAPTAGQMQSGSYSFTVTITDVAGRVATVSGAWSITS